MLWLSLFFSCNCTSETSIDTPKNPVEPEAKQEERPPALNKDGLPNLLPLDDSFQGLEKGCTLTQETQTWLNSLAVYMDSYSSCLLSDLGSFRLLSPC